MTRLFSDDDFSSLLDSDRTWRIREISDLKSAILRADPQLRNVLLRANITVCYAHWEGHVRLAAKQYMRYIAFRKHFYKDLHIQFLKNYFLPKLVSLTNNKSNVYARCDLLDDIFDGPKKRFTQVNDDLINTKSNLNSEVLKELCLICGVQWEIFEHDRDFIDVLLLRRRNSIAHGENTFIGIEDLDEISNRTIKLMRMFSDALQNIIALRRYEAA